MAGKQKRPGKARPLMTKHSLGERRYFAAVGSGTGFSASVAR